MTDDLRAFKIFPTRSLLAILLLGLLATGCASEPGPQPAAIERAIPASP